MVVEKKLYTVEEFEGFAALPENRDLNLELINGEIIEKAMPNEIHAYLVARLIASLIYFSDNYSQGRVLTECRIRFPNDMQNARQPDISYYADNSRPMVLKGAVPLTPDLIIEVKSPDDTYKLMRDKATYYVSIGAKLVWLVFPEKHIVEVFTQASHIALTENDTLNGDALLPGFEFSLQKYFKLPGGD